MGSRGLELTVISAKGLKDIGKFSKMDVYVAVTINGDPRTELRTPVDQDGGSSPKWSHPMKFEIDDHRNLFFRLRHERVLLGDKDVGEVHVPVKELLDKFSTGDNSNAVLAEFPVRSASGKMKGKLKFSYKFESPHGSHYPVHAIATPPTSVTKPYPLAPGPTMPSAMAYPPSGSGPFVPPPTGYAGVPAGYPVSPAGYPVAPAGAGYHDAPAAGHPGRPHTGYNDAPAGYHYPSAPIRYPPPALGSSTSRTESYPYPSQATYGYPSAPPAGYPQVQPETKKSGMGTGLGVGILGGLVGGMVLGGLASDFSGGFD